MTSAGATGALRQAILFTGHMVDAPDRPLPRFPSVLVPAAARRITQGAAGGDLLFAEACLARGVPLRLLLPLCEREFVAASLLPVQDGSAWHARFRAVLARLDRAPSEAPQELGALADGEDPFVRGNLWLLASARAAERLCCICLWDGGGGDGPGGTGHLVETVREAGGTVLRIDTRTL